MLRLFIVNAVLWLFVVAFLIFVAGHQVAAHWFTFLWLTALAIALPFGWRWFAAYKVTASVASRIDAAEGKLWTKVVLTLEGIKSALLMLLVSGFSAGKDWIETTLHGIFGLSADALDPFKDISLLHAFFDDTVAPKIVSGVTLFAAFLSIHSKLQAAKIVPALGTAAPVVPTAPAGATPTS